MINSHETKEEMLTVYLEALCINILYTLAFSIPIVILYRTTQKY